MADDETGRNTKIFNRDVRQKTLEAVEQKLRKNYCGDS